MPHALRTTAAALALALSGFSADAQNAGPPRFTDLGELVGSEANGYKYGYGPALVRTGGRWFMLYCSEPGGPANSALDWLRSSSSNDGANWSRAELRMTVSNPQNERAACDPALVRYQAPADDRPYWYVFYSGTPLNVGTAMFVARSDAIEGPYAKWTGADWEEDAPNPRAIIKPAAPKPEGAGFYGAGQQSVVVRDGQLYGWFTDDTTCGPTPCVRIFFSRTDDPTRWSERVPTNVTGIGSVDVKLERSGDRFVMWGIEGAHTAESALSRRFSTDGVTWTEPEIVADASAFPDWAHNVGVGADASGRIFSDVLVGFGAPNPADPACGSCWGRWNMQGGVVRGGR